MIDEKLLHRINMPLDITSMDIIMFGLLLASVLNWKVPFHCLVSPMIEICDHCLREWQPYDIH